MFVHDPAGGDAERIDVERMLERVTTRPASVAMTFFDRLARAGAGAGAGVDSRATRDHAAELARKRHEAEWQQVCYSDARPRADA